MDFRIRLIVISIISRSAVVKWKCGVTKDPRLENRAIGYLRLPPSMMLTSRAFISDRYWLGSLPSVSGRLAADKK